MPVDVVVVQHGEKNPDPGDPGLTPLGRHQAARTARWLAAMTSANALYSSPMRRALETAAPIARELGLAVRIDPRLRERMNWNAETQSIDEFAADWARASIDRDFTPPSGDSSRRAGDRYLDVLNEIVERLGVGVAVVVTHGGVTVDFLRTLMGDAAVLKLAPSLIPDGVPGCAVTRFTKTRWGWAVTEIASAAHLMGHEPLA